MNIEAVTVGAALAGAGIAVAMSVADRSKIRRTQQEHEILNVKDL